jgi:hypothetical protein
MNSRMRSEEGAILVYSAFLLLLLFVVAALVIDLGGLRVDRGVDQLTTDIAATAGAGSLNPFGGGDAQEACQTAWQYALENLGNPVVTSLPDCSVFSTACDAAIARSTTGVAAEYTISITQPVPDGDPLMGSQAPDSDVDGSACQRIGVEIQRNRQFTFARIIGSDSGTTSVSSVARIGPGSGTGELVPLLVLEPIACDALYTSGQGRVTVTYNGLTPGYIIVDSDGSKSDNPNRCGNNSYTIDPHGGPSQTNQDWIRALPVPAPDDVPSAILSYALSGKAGAVPAKAYNPDDLDDFIPDCVEAPETCYRLFPRPIGATDRITRAPIDWRYNCLSSYPDYPLDPDNPAPDDDIDVPGCPKASTRPSYIEALRDTLVDGTIPESSYQIYGDDPGESCDLQSSDPDVTLSGNVYVDCPGGFSVFNVVTFQGGNVVFEGGVSVGSGGTLIINSGADAASGAGQDRVVVIRHGDFYKVAQASLYLPRTMVYLNDGAIDFGGGSGDLDWTAPTGAGTGETQFEDLALWSESSAQHSLGGQTGNHLEGTLFTPNADPFSLTGQAGQFQARAQFLTRRLEIGGQGEVRMAPDPDRVTLVPIREIMLIR